jgi:hypothetical protein
MCVAAAAFGYTASMTLPLYVVLPAGAEWTAVPGTTAQSPRPVQWYLRQHMVEAVTQVGVFVAEGASEAEAVAGIVAQAHALGGAVVDAATHEPVLGANASVSS